MARAPVFPTKLLDKTATVYSADPASGAYTIVAKEGLACMLGIANPSGARTGAERADLAQVRTLLWTEDYAMGDDVQVEVDGERWNIIPGSYSAPAWPFSGTIPYRCCDVMRAK